MESLGLENPQINTGVLPDPDFWRGKRVLLTGHTGFKGAWCALWLWQLGAKVTAFSLPPERPASLYELARVGDFCEGRFMDLRSTNEVQRFLKQSGSQIVIHMAAQALVRRSVKAPLTTWSTNVQGTLNLLEGLRHCSQLEAVLIVTTDKVYENDGSGRPFKEEDKLGGRDPYSASKAACDIAVASFAKTFFEGIPIARVRGGNVIGGGDFSEDRLVPDCVRAVTAGHPVVLRQPSATRPWQHVLDCLCGYLVYVQSLVTNPHTPLALNIGPHLTHDLPVLVFAKKFLSALDASHLLKVNEEKQSIETSRLALDPALAHKTLGWRDRLIGMEAINATSHWYRCWMNGQDMRERTLKEIQAYQQMEYAA